MIKAIFTVLLLLLFNSEIGDANARKGNTAYENENFEEAEAFYRMSIEKNPESARLYFNLGNALAKQGKTDEAISAYMDFENLTEEPAEKALAEYNIGTLLSGDENWQPAVMHLKNSLRLNPQDYDTKLNYELAVQSLLNEEEEQPEQEQNQENQPPPEPTEYALAVKQQADKLVDMKRYNLAYDLMTTAMVVDPSIAYFGDFIERLGNVDKIEP